MRALRDAALVTALVAVPACWRPGAPPAPPPDAAREDEGRFRALEVDFALPDVDALGYEVDLRVTDLPRGHETFAADVKGVYAATRDLDELTLDFDGNVIDAIEVEERAARHRRSEGKLVITLPHLVPRGKTFTSRVRYHGAVLQADGADANDFSAFGGFYVKQRNSEGKRIFSSLAWPRKARRWLPLRDHPSDGAMLAMNVTFPRSFTVLANGQPTARVLNGDGSLTSRFEALTPMPPFDFHVAAYESWKLDAERSSSGVLVATYSYADAERKQRAVYGDVPRAVDFYERTFGPYRFGRVSFIEEPIFGGAMEHASVVSMDETLFREAAGVAEARSTAFHELAHHWCGNSVRIRSWNDLWLSEGFAEYLTARFVAANDGALAKQKVLRGYLRDALAGDATRPHPIRPPDPEVDVLTIFDAISYQKGALVLRALERLVGERELTAFLHGWFDRHAFRAANTADFARELGAATGSDLSAFFAGFVYGAGHPELRVTFAAGSANEVAVTVEQLQTDGPANGFVFPLDVDLVDDAGHAARATIDVTARKVTSRIATRSSVKTLVVDPDEYLLGAVTCDASPKAAACKGDFTCTNGKGPRDVCLPR